MVIAGLALMLVACGRPVREPTAAKPSGPPRTVKVAQVERRGMERAIFAPGTLSPWESATISTKVAGRLQRLEVDVGTALSQGDLIAQVEPRDFELRVQQAAAALAEARAALGLPLEGEAEQVDAQAVSSVKQAKAVLEEAAKNLDRIRSLTLSRIASASELDSVEAAHKVAQTRYDAALEEARARVAALAQRRVEYQIAKKLLSDTSILAPFVGAIQVRHANRGEYVAAGSPIVTLVQSDPLRLRIEVPEREALSVRTGQMVRLTVQGETNRFSGRITRLSPALNETNRMLLVEADVPNPGLLRGGLFARTQIIVNPTEEGLSVPENALLTFAGIEKVVTVDKGKALEKSVTTGRRGPGWIEVISGVEAGAIVVLDPTGLRTGQPVTISNPTQSSRTRRALSPPSADG